jgi:hypothetical protein
MGWRRSGEVLWDGLVKSMGCRAGMRRAWKGLWICASAVRKGEGRRSCGRKDLGETHARAASYHLDLACSGLFRRLGRVGRPLQPRLPGTFLHFQISSHPSIPLSPQHHSFPTPHTCSCTRTPRKQPLEGPSVQGLQYQLLHQSSYFLVPP